MSTASSTPDPILKQTYRDLINGSHILHYHKVLDAYGHLSLRHPHNPTHFLLSRSIAPALITASTDIMTYHISDASPINPTSTAKDYVERFIHSEIYKRHPTVQAIVHSHSPDLIPYGISGHPVEGVLPYGGIPWDGGPGLGYCTPLGGGVEEGFPGEGYQAWCFIGAKLWREA
ncbi:hypothetical protein PRZ48_003293 [Zasmidium cellare]|uniref:Class II aldolase/adducin N-terminal domain-containing protein n=1 Tax=Zasmidium cellare TaxID=395010 RepID=A0ABR0EVP2_ZASCE|nr:hypothetical protein PRZ48_003293 [Zasmidium cellare]